MKYDDARERLIRLLREHSLVPGQVTLSSGAIASYYVDARRTVMRPEGQRAAGELIAHHAKALGASAVGGPVMAASPTRLCRDLGARGRRSGGPFVRKEREDTDCRHAWVEGGAEPGDRVLVVEDTVTTGGSRTDLGDRDRRSATGLRDRRCAQPGRPPGRRRRSSRSGRGPLRGPDHHRRRLPVHPTAASVAQLVLHAALYSAADCVPPNCRMKSLRSLRSSTRQSRTASRFSRRMHRSMPARPVLPYWRMKSWRSIRSLLQYALATLLTVPAEAAAGSTIAAATMSPVRPAEVSAFFTMPDLSTVVCARAKPLIHIS